MKSKSKLIIFLISLSLIYQTNSLSFAKNSEGKDIDNFKKVTESNITPDINVSSKGIENPNFDKNTPVSKALKEDPYELYTDYSAIDKNLKGNNLPSIFLIASPDSVIGSKYDLRDLGKVTSVKDQGPNGSCWAFATYGSAESILMPYQRMDFSEKHMRNTHGFDWGPSEGGTRTVSTAYLARRSGPVLEKDDPYDIYGSNSPENLPVAKELTQAIFLQIEEMQQIIIC